MPILRNRTFCLAAALAFFAGWQASQWHTRRNQPVYAQSSDIRFQFQNLSGQSSLMLYYPESQTVYVYPSVAVGSNFLSCAFSFKLEKPGEPIRRDQCPIATRR